MASLAYISIPPCATPLQSPSSSLRRAKKVTTPLPNPTPPTSAPSTTQAPSGMNSSTAAAFSLLPQMLLSATLPNTPSLPSLDKEKDMRKGPQLLTTKEPLSIPITTANFKRFVAKVGPIFWMQDRIEEVVLWKRGWKVTGLWIAVYAFFCYFPMMVFAIPHMILIGIMLASYPFSKPKPGEIPSTDSVNWQGNLQGIQNLMGFVADTNDLIQPHLHLLVLKPAHISSQTPVPPPPISTYPPLILLTLLLTFPPLVALLASPIFPARLVCLVAGLLPLVATHPRVLPILPTLGKLAVRLTQSAVVILVRRYSEIRMGFLRLWMRIKGKGDVGFDAGKRDVELPPLRTILERIRDNDRLDDICWNAEMREVELFENERYVPPRSRVGTGSSGAINTPPPVYNTNTDIKSNPSSPTSTASFTGTANHIHRLSLPPPPQSIPSNTITPDPSDPGWAKANLKSGDRRAWTRGRDGWGGVRGRGGEGEGDGEGVVSSNLTFSLASGWAFVASEGWRRDLGRRWVGEAEGDGLDLDADADGWVYTNDTWGGARGTSYAGSVTRRRRWVRRVWFDGNGNGNGDGDGVGSGI